MSEEKNLDKLAVIETEETAIAPGLLEFIDLESEEAALFNLNASLTRRIDYDSAIFRNIKASSERTFTWNVPGTDMKELHRDVVAMRGIILKAKFGFALFNGKEKKLICNTISMQPNRGPEVQDKQPMNRPIYSPQKYNQPRTPDADILIYNTVGSRGKTCYDCVSCGESIHTYTDDKGQQKSDECGLTTSVIMCVMQMGLLKQNLAQRRMDMEWVNVVDVKDAEGNLIYKEPFIVNLQLSRMPVMRAIGKKLQVKYEGEPGGYAARGSQTLAAFLNDLYNNNMVRPAKGNKIVYMPVIDVFSAQPTEAFAKDVSQMVKAIPVFKIVETNPAAWLNTAWSLYDTQLNSAKENGVSERLITSDSSHAETENEPNGSTKAKETVEPTTVSETSAQDGEKVNGSKMSSNLFSRKS